MHKRKLRVLIARFGEGYEVAMLKLADACSEAGFEVIYTEMQDPEAIVVAALQESVDHIGITTLPGATVEQFAELFKSLRKHGLDGVRVTAGGFFPPDDVERIKELGVTEFYPRGALYNRIEQWTKEYGKVTAS